MYAWFLRLLPDASITKRYIEAGAEVGDSISYSYMGTAVGFEALQESWRVLEEEYARRGYRTISLLDFMYYGGYGTQLKDVGTKRRSDEDPIFHAQIHYSVDIRGSVPGDQTSGAFCGTMEIQARKPENS